MKYQQFIIFDEISKISDLAEKADRGVFEVPELASVVET